MKIAFFLLHYPVFSETFVSQEILNLQQQSLNGVIVCEKKINTPPFHPHIKKIKFPIIEISQKIFSSSNFLSTISAHFYWLFKKPLKYFYSLYLLSLFFSYHHLRVFIKSPLLAKKLLFENVDLIYVHEVDSPCLYGLICSKLLDIPCGIIFHTQYLLSQNKFLIPKIKHASFIIFQSKYSRSKAKKITHLSSTYFKKSYVLPLPGIDTNFFAPPQKLSFSKSIRLLSLGRLEEAKGYPNLLKAIKILVPQYPHIKLDIIGDGQQRLMLQNYIDTYHLNQNVHLLGFIPHNQHLIKLINNHSYFIFPSIVDSQKVHDVQPNALKEAMSCSRIVITSNLGSIHEIISNQNNGYLLSSTSPKSISKTILAVHRLPTNIKRKVANSARESILKNHRQEIICHQLKQIFFQYQND